MTIQLPEDAVTLLDTLTRAGHTAYAVGGCVRDSLMGHTPKDWDIATSATPDEVKALFSRTADTGIKHGTVTVLIRRQPYEVTTYRVDGLYLDGRRPSSVAFAANIEDDLSRRDFTMNAVAYHPAHGFVDPFGGRADISRKIIRAVGRAEHRFSEDALRMLRAVRFAAQLGFTVEEETLLAIAPLSDNMRHVSAERVREELTRLLTGPYPEALFLLETTGLLPYTLRGRAFGGDLREAATRIARCPKIVPMVYTLFLAWAGPECESILRDLRFDNKTTRETAAYVHWLPVPLINERFEIKKALNRMPPEQFGRLITLKALTDGAVSGDVNSFTDHCQNNPQLQLLEAVRETVKDIVEKQECFTLQELAVNGDDLVAAGTPRGKPTGDMLAYLLEAVMHEPSLNNREDLLKLAALTDGSGSK